MTQLKRQRIKIFYPAVFLLAVALNAMIQCKEAGFFNKSNMKKVFLSSTAVIEALTGIGLILAPSTIVAVLFKTELSNPLERLLAMIAGAAICAVAMIAWLVRSLDNPSIALKMLIFYNIVVGGVLLYGIMALGFGGFVLWGVIIFHLAMFILATMTLRKIPNSL